MVDLISGPLFPMDCCKLEQHPPLELEEKIVTMHIVTFVAVAVNYVLGFFFYYLDGYGAWIGTRKLYPFWPPSSLSLLTFCQHWRLQLAPGLLILIESLI